MHKARVTLGHVLYTDEEVVSAAAGLWETVQH
jgi:hypothetical protein